MYIVSLGYKEITFHSTEMYNSAESSGVLSTKIIHTEMDNICNSSHAYETQHYNCILLAGTLLKIL